MASCSAYPRNRRAASVRCSDALCSPSERARSPSATPSGPAAASASSATRALSTLPSGLSADPGVPDGARPASAMVTPSPRVRSVVNNTCSP
ncbi:Uncharacterised protein [Mycobacteroides abscessus]|nr:Uncharacterised protein [Mycobacteroides abscessus]